MTTTNDNLVLLVGPSAVGKSASLRDITDHPGVMYLNCEAGKKLPFKNKFEPLIITDPYTVLQAFDEAENMPQIHTIVVDSLTFLLEMYESIFVHGQADGRAAWGNFAQFFKTLMQDKVANSTKNVIFIAHTLESYNPTEMTTEIKVPVKGALKNVGIESYFTSVIAAKKVRLVDLETFKNPMLTITPDDEALGFKYVFQTKLTKGTTNERLRGPMGMWNANETFIDNNMQYVLTRLKDYYA